MSSVTYLYDVGTTAYVLIAGACAGTYSAHPAMVNRVEIKVSQASPTPVTSINYVVTLTDNNSVVNVAEADTFVDKPTAAAEAVTRYQALFL